MNKLTLLGFVIFQGVAVSSYAAPAYTSKAESSATETDVPDGVSRTLVNTSFSFTTLYNHKNQNYTDGLIAQRIESTVVSGKGNANPKFEATAWIGGKNKYDTKLWTIDDCAESGWQAGDFYVTSKYGMDGEANILRAYNLSTGKYAFSFTTDPVSVDIAIPKDNIKRYIAYLSRVRKDSECRKNEVPANAIGALTLSDGKAQMDRIVLQSADEDLLLTPKVSLVNDKDPKGASKMSIWGPADFANKSEAVKGFSVKVVFQDGKEAIIPVINDKFDIQKATVPQSMKIQRIDTEKTDSGKS